MNPELLIAREVAGTLTDGEAAELESAFDPAAWLEDRRMDGLLRGCYRRDDDFEDRLKAKLRERAAAVRLLKQGYLGTLDLAARIRAGLLSALTREQQLWRPRPDMPPALWHAAHLAVTDAAAWIGCWKGDWAALDERWFEFFGMGSAMPQDAGRWPSLEEIQSVAPRVRGIVDDLTSGDLDRPLPHYRAGLLEPSLKTPGDCLRMLSVHHTWHTAEINVLCRLQGRSRLL